MVGGIGLPSFRFPSSLLRPSPSPSDKLLAASYPSSSSLLVAVVMYYYISFLRNPPKSVSLSDQVSFSPQVANDLRTECKPSFYPLLFPTLYIVLTSLFAWCVIGSSKRPSNSPTPGSLRPSSLLLALRPQQHLLHIRTTSPPNL